MNDSLQELGEQTLLTGDHAGNAVADKLVTFTYNDNGQFVTITRYASLDGS